LQLLDVSTYLNHYYLAALLCWLLLASPAGRAWSVDAWVCRLFLGRAPASERAARAWLYLFRFQIALVYVGAALAKAQPDWLVHAQPLRIWLGASAELPLLGRLLAIDGMPLVLSWCGFLFDATIVGWLSWHRTRPYAYAVVLVFHALTRVLFPIGMFPVIMSVSALVFFDPSWPRAFLARVFARRLELPPPLAVRATPTSAFALYVGAAYCALQLVLPLRFVAYGGDVLWHEQGMRFSWRVMVRAKGGSTTFLVRNKRTGQVWHVSPAEYLTPLQESEMAVGSPHPRRHRATRARPGRSARRCASFAQWPAQRSDHRSESGLGVGERRHRPATVDPPRPRQLSAPYPNLAVSPLCVLPPSLFQAQ
jgi:hypothetical protein